MGEAALQAGNSESIIRKHYLDSETKAEADAFFAITPSPHKIAAFPRPLATGKYYAAARRPERIAIPV